MSDANYYEVLDVNKDSSADEIKKKYRKLSMKYHPDRNENSKESENIFKKISEAYDTLGDATKRREYDFMNNMGSSTSSGPNDLFNMFFRGGPGGMQGVSTIPTMSKVSMPPIFSMFNMGQADMSQKMPGIDSFIIEQMEQELKNMFISGSGNSSHNRNHVQKRNHDEYENKDASQLRPTTIHANINIDITQAYSGCSLPIEIDREIWHDSSVREREVETIYIDIPKGIDDNEVVTIKDKGHVNKYNKCGDIKVHVKIENNTEFTRNGIDLILHKHITLKESLCGFYFEFTHITGKVFKIHNKIGNIISPEFKKKINKLGMTRDNHVGNLIIFFHVKYPEEIDVEKLKQIESILDE